VTGKSNTHRGFTETYCNHNTLPTRIIGSFLMVIIGGGRQWGQGNGVSLLQSGVPLRPVFRCQPTFLAVSFSAQRFLTCPCPEFPYWSKPHFRYFSIFSDRKQGRRGQGPISFCWGMLHLFAHIGMMISFQLAVARINYNLCALVPQRNGLVTVHVLNHI